MVRTVGIVSLSRGLLGEASAAHTRDIGVKRLEAYGLRVRFLPHALCGLSYLQAHPEKRAEDLLQAFRDPDIDMILCAIGGDDTYRLLPYLFDYGQLQNAVSHKIFLGFSDTTINHFMLHKVGLPTFYGQAFLPDVCELDTEMLPYTKGYFEELITTGRIGSIRPSPVWYESRTGFGPDQIGMKLSAHPDEGFVLLQGPEVFSGPILGGCIDSMLDLFDPGRYADMPVLNQKYGLFPHAEEWRGKILLLESSEEKMPPEKYEHALLTLKKTGIFSAVNGVLVGKPMDKAYAEAYQRLLVDVIDDPALPILYNLNVGHALPRCIVPFGAPATVDARAQRITFG